jgi:molybdopterin molybdotransferase
MISVAEALQNVTSGVDRLTDEQVSLVDALGRVLAEDIGSRVTHPPVAVSAMDGYAVRAVDVAEVPATLEKIGESAAGKGFSGTVGAGQCVRIFTGAPVPAGADAVVMQEDTEADDNTVIFHQSVAAGHFIRPAGLDFSEGQVLLHAGQVLTARDIGLAAAMNVPWLKVRRRPRVAFLATGDEVVLPGDPLKAEQIISSNSLALGAYVRAMGGEPTNLGIAGDDEDSLQRLLAGASGADLLVTIGGASVGDYDLVRKVLGEEGLQLTFYKVAMQPGKPLIFGHLGKVPVLGLPGNPVSAGVTAVIFLKAAMEVMLGVRLGDRATPMVRLGCDLAANGRRQAYLRATLGAGPDGSQVATPFDQQDSAMMARLAQADCLVVRPPHAPAITAGEQVEIVPLREGTVTT